MAPSGPALPASAPSAVVYLTNNGLGEPHVASQVLPYLERLRRPVHLVTCEKQGADAQAVEEARRRLDRIGAGWTPLPYRGPPLGTWRNVRELARAAVQAAREAGPALYHARSYIAAAAARRAARLLPRPWVFDMRGFHLEERIDDGRLRRGSLQHRLLLRQERRLLAEADAVVVLTQAARRALAEGRLGTVPRDVRVVPCAVDLDAFPPRAEGVGDPAVLCYSGSLGPGFLVPQMGEFAALLARRGPWRLAVASRQDARGLVEAATRAGLPASATSAASLRPSQVPAFLATCDAGLLFLRSSLAKLASSPIKVAEYLATGLPVALTPGCGDTSGWIEEEGVGVVVDPSDAAGLERGAARLAQLLRTPGIRSRCRAAAASRLHVDRLAPLYEQLYRDLERTAKP